MKKSLILKKASHFHDYYLKINKIYILLVFFIFWAKPNKIKMVTLEKFTMDKSSVIESPKDEILEAIIINFGKTTWKNIISPDKISKFENPDDEVVMIDYEYLFKGNHQRNNETFKFYEKPQSNSKLGKFLLKYGELKTGTQIKVIFSSEGIPSIKLD